jgi:hypothetical protein
VSRESREKPLINREGVVLKHWQDVLAAIANDKTQMDVTIVEGLDESDLLRFINICLFFKKLTYRQRFELIIRLEKYLKETVKGKIWSKSLQEGKKSFDIFCLLNLMFFIFCKVKRQPKIF